MTGVIPCGGSAAWIISSVDYKRGYMSLSAFFSIARKGATQVGMLALGALMPALAFGAATGTAAAAAPGPLGIFEGQQDVGVVSLPGSAQYDSITGTYTVSGSGQDMWAGDDEFHFVWKKVSGDVALTANIAFLHSSVEPHRKAVVMIRQTLDSNSPGVDVAVHGNGLASLQFRDAAGASLGEIQSNITAPQTVRIEKRGDSFYGFVAGPDGKLVSIGASTRLALTGSFYVGIGICAHSQVAADQAAFSHVRLEELAPAAGKPVESPSAQ
jgi:TolB protein